MTTPARDMKETEKWTLEDAKLIRHPMYQHIHDDSVICAKCRGIGFEEGHTLGRSEMAKKVNELKLKNEKYQKVLENIVLYETEKMGAADFRNHVSRILIIAKGALDNNLAGGVNEFWG